MKGENRAPISYQLPLRSFVTAAQHRNVAGKRVFFHFQECRIYTPTLSSRDATTRSFRSIA